MQIREVMTTPAVTVTTQSSTGTALWLMREEQISSVPVVDDRGALIGVISETDLRQDRAPAAARVPYPAGPDSGSAPSHVVGDAMTHQVAVVSPNDEIDDALDLMRSTITDYLPVVENDRVVGTVGRGDLTRQLTHCSSSVRIEISAGTAYSADPVTDVR